MLKLPASIDPHVHFRTPGAEHKENWTTGSKAALRGGVTMVLDMPNTNPATITADRIGSKRALIDEQLAEVGLPLRYGLYLGADCDHLDEIPKSNGVACGLKIYMGNSTGNLVMEGRAPLARAFALAAESNMVVAVHAEDEGRMGDRARQFAGSTDPATHSKIRDPEAARLAVVQAIGLAAKSGARLYIAHVSTRAELDAIREGRESGVTVYAEATPHHLFLDTSAYETLGCRVLVNPSLRDPIEREALWDALLDGTIDTVGSDHAPHTIAEKEQPYDKAPSGLPGVEHTLPLLLTQVAKGKLSLERVIELTRTRTEEIFSIEPTDDQVWVDMDQLRSVGEVASRCGWTPYAGWELTGWPTQVRVAGRLFRIADGVIEEIELDQATL